MIIVQIRVRERVEYTHKSTIAATHIQMQRRERNNKVTE
jgi:hypothetical protein